MRELNRDEINELADLFTDEDWADPVKLADAEAWLSHDCLVKDWMRREPDGSVDITPQIGGPDDHPMRIIALTAVRQAQARLKENA